MNTASRVALFFVLVFSFISIQSTAQELNPALAKEKFQEGMRQIREHEYQDALGSFEESYRHKPKAVVLFNIAMCQKALFRYSEALEAFKRYMEEAGDSPKPDLRSEVKAAIIEIEQLVGKVFIKGAPAKSKVYFDEEFVGETPLAEPIAANPGRYIARIVAPEGAYMETIVAVVAGAHVTVNANLRIIPPGPPGPNPGEPTDPIAKALEEKKKKFFKIGKISTISAGLASGIAGIILTVRGNAVYLAAQDLGLPDGEGGRYVTTQEALEDFNEKSARLDRIEVGMIITYSLAGVMLTTGLALVAIDTNRKDKVARSVSLRVTPTGIIGEF